MKSAQLRISKKDADRLENYERWRDLTRPMFDGEPVNGAEGFEFFTQFYVAGDIVISEVSSDALQMRRTRAHTETYPSEGIALQAYQAGGFQGTNADRSPFEIKTGQLMARDMRRAYEGVASKRVNSSVFVPLKLLPDGARVFDERFGVFWEDNSPEKLLLQSSVLFLKQKVIAGEQSDVNVLASGFAGLLNGLLAAQSTTRLSEDHDAWAFNSIKAYISAKVSSGEFDFDAEELCGRFGCSRATLYRRFRRAGGVRNYVNGLRLDYCFREIALADPGSGFKIRHSAERMGFFDSKSFHRMFKDRFGAAPSDFVGFGRQKANPDADEELDGASLFNSALSRF